MKFLLSALLLISLNAMAAAPAKPLPKKAAKAPASAESMAPAAATSDAAPAANQTSTTAVGATQQSWLLQKLSVGAVLSQADTFKGATFIAGSSKADADINSSTTLGITAQLTETAKWNNVGWYAAGTVEQTREFSSLKVGSGSLAIPQKPNYRPWILSGGANYQFNSAVYALAGLNYTLYTEKSSGIFDSFEMNPLLGYQVGVGAKIQKVTVELSLREVTYDMSMRKGALKVEGRSTLTGLNLQARYNF